jgi:hypothetical protein
MSSDNNEGPIYGPNDFEIIMNHVHQNLCTLDEGDRAVGRPAQWQDLKELTNRLEAYSVRKDILYLADYMLKDERELIECDKSTLKVRLTKKGRDLCGQRLSE